LQRKNKISVALVAVTVHLGMNSEYPRIVCFNERSLAALESNMDAVMDKPAIVSKAALVLRING
jgi:hypothetical protein